MVQTRPVMFVRTLTGTSWPHGHVVAIITSPFATSDRLRSNHSKVYVNSAVSCTGASIASESGRR
jgi:hypothetical protein